MSRWHGNRTNRSRDVRVQRGRSVADLAHTGAKRLSKEEARKECEAAVEEWRKKQEASAAIKSEG